MKKKVPRRAEEGPIALYYLSFLGGGFQKVFCDDPTYKRRLRRECRLMYLPSTCTVADAKFVRAEQLGGYSAQKFMACAFSYPMVSSHAECHAPYYSYAVLPLPHSVTVAPSLFLTASSPLPVAYLRIACLLRYRLEERSNSCCTTVQRGISSLASAGSCLPWSDVN
jgi:hypothetical protein